MWSSQRGQASVELIGVLPAVLLVGALLWQLALAGEAAWLCANAARAGARAAAVGRSAEDAARSALPAALARGLKVSRAGGGAGDDGVVRVRLRIPLLVHAWRSPFDVSATAGLASGGGT